VSDRDANGRFRDGCRPGPGRPRRAVERDYLATLADAVPMDRWRAIVDRAVDNASQGDAKARQWISEYLIGKPSGDGLTKLAAAENPDPLDIAMEEAQRRNYAKLVALACED
jgi:hypothetical protein